jgi:tetratricopeptide (TPR) repeat protein
MHLGIDKRRQDGRLMRMFKTFLSATVLTFTLLSQFAWADPITKEAAAARIDKLCLRNGLPPGCAEIMQAGLENNRIVIERKLQANPFDKGLIRDLGDAFHSLGHFAEYANNYDLALSYHTQALVLYKRSGERAFGSWDDGTEHAYEHIFMDLYDQAITFERAGEMSKAEMFFERAWQASEKVDVVNSRVTDRYYPLAKRRQKQKQPLSSRGQKFADHFCTWEITEGPVNDD